MPPTMSSPGTERAAASSTPERGAITSVIVREKDTVGAMMPGMPPVAATPYLVAIAEAACERLVKDMLEEGQITVGTRVVIDHLGPSKVGAELTLKTALLSRERNRFQIHRHHRRWRSRGRQSRARTRGGIVRKADERAGLTRACTHKSAMSALIPKS
jgi:predicted thioesterase